MNTALGTPGRERFQNRQNGITLISLMLPPGIIVGTLYDSNTPYSFTQEMRTNCKFRNLLTSHGIGSDPLCQRHVIDYLENGYVGFTDGQFCGAGPADLDAFGKVFGIDGLDSLY